MLNGVESSRVAHTRDVTERRANELLVLYQACAPQDVEASNRLDDWRLYAPALVARCAYLLGSIMRLRGRDVDAMILARALWEHVLTLAWISEEPHTRLPRAVGEEYRKRLAADDELGGFGQRKLPPAVRAEFEKYRDGLKSAGAENIPSVLEMARQADAFWGARLEALAGAGRGSLSASYTILYRQFSWYAHPTTAALQRFVLASGTDKFEIGWHDSAGRIEAFRYAPTLFAQLLLLTAHVLGWPNADEVNDVFSRHPMPEKRTEQE